MDFVDFHLEIRSSEDAQDPRRPDESVYSVSAQCKLAGESDEKAEPLRLTETDFEDLRRGLYAAAPSVPSTPSAHRDVRASGPPRPPSLAPRQIGTALFRTFLGGDVGRLFYESLATLHERRGQVLQLKVELSPKDPGFPRLHLLPWELLYNPRHHRFLALSESTSVVRYLRVQSPTEAPPPPSRLRVLVAVANPSDTEPLDVEEEVRRLQGLARQTRRGLYAFFGGVHVEVLERASLAGISEALQRARGRERPFHALHVLGHGGLDASTGQGLLYLTASAGDSEPVPASVWAQELSDHRELQLVFLNACLTTRFQGEGGYPGERRRGSGGLNPVGPSPLDAGLAHVAGALVTAGVPRVVAMQQRITDEAALDLGETFYRHAFAGSTVAAAVRAARKRLLFQETTRLEWSVPALFQRAPDDALYRPPARWPPRAALAAALVLSALALWAWPAPLEPCEQRMSEQVRQTLEQATLQIRERNTQDARQLLQKVLRQAPDLAVAHSSLAFLEDREGALERAADHYRAAVAARPDCPLHRYNLGAFYEANDRSSEAIPELHRAVELDAGHIRSYNALGLANLDLHRPEEAARWLEIGLRRVRDGGDRPRDLQVESLLLNNLGRAWIASRKPSQARVALRRALQITPPEEWLVRDEIVVWMARAEQALGKADVACQHLTDRFAEREGPADAPWEPEALELARTLGCPYDSSAGGGRSED